MPYNQSRSLASLLCFWPWRAKSLRGDVAVRVTVIDEQPGYGVAVGAMFSLLMKHKIPSTTPLATCSVFSVKMR